MRGVIFSSMISTTVTMPALVVLAGMAAYWLHRRFFPGNDPRPDAFAFLTALLPFAIVLYNWPQGYVSSSKTTVIVCAYILYYLVGLSIYCVVKQAEAQGRRKVFRFFFVSLTVTVVVAMLMTIPSIANILAFVGGVGLIWAAVYVVTQSIAGSVWEWSPQKPQPAVEPVDVEEPAPVAPQPESAATPQKFFLCGGVIIGIAWFCLYAYALNPAYLPLVLFWTGFAGVMLAKRKEPGPSPAPSSLSQETG